MEQQSFDAIIIGAGHNGLAAAIHLAARFWSVFVVEGAERASGAVKTEELTLPGYRQPVAYPDSPIGDVAT